MSYSRKSRIRSRLYFSGVTLLAILVALIVCNSFLHLYKDAIPRAASKYFSQKVRIDNLLYLPPNFIFLKNISLSEPSAPEGEKIVSLPLVMVKFAPFKSFESGKIVITDICVYDLQSEYADLRDFLRNNFKQIWQFFLDLPRQDIRFMVKDARVDLAPENGGPGYYNSRVFLKIKNNGFYGYGTFGRNTENHSGIPLDFTFKGALEKDGMSLDNLEVMRENVYAKLWGSVHDYVLRLNGFTFINTSFKEHAYYEPFLTYKERLDNFLRGFPAPPASVEMPKVDLFILDLESQIDIRPPVIDIQRLGFSLNNNPMSLTGKIEYYWDKPILLDLDYSTRYSQLKNWTSDSPTLKNIDIAFKGSFQDKVFRGNSVVKFDFLKKSGGSLPLEEFTAGLEDLVFSFQKFPKLTASVKDLDFFCKTDTRDYKLRLQYLGMAADLKDPKLKYCEFDGRFYDGRLRSRVRADMRHVPPNLTVDLRIHNATANKLESLLEHFSKVHGKISGQMRFRNFPQMNLKGGVIVNQGYIEDFEFLKWLAGFFDLPSMRKMEFDRMTTNFSVDPEGAGISSLHLASGGVVLGGNFHLGTNDMVNSKLSLTCSRQLLQRPAKFRPLLRLIGKNVDALTFEFRLSGNLNKMNFLWLESDFKHRLRNAIPNFMERSVEKKIEDSLQQLSQ